MRPIRRDPPPEGFHLEAVQEKSDWQIYPLGDHRCRWTDHGERCPNRSVARLNRRHYKRGVYPPIWWHYCAGHMFGRWVEDGKVMAWALRKDEP